MDCPNPSIPDDALVEILSRLPVKPVRRAKCVSKSWRDLIDDPLHRKKLPQTLEGFFFMDWISDSSTWHLDLRFVNRPAREERPMRLDVDPRFSFLRAPLLPGIESLTLKDSCNGLLLFEKCRKSDPDEVCSYIVCNPVTRRWGTVPTCDCPWNPPPSRPTSHTHLLFDPSASSHFSLVKFCYDWGVGEQGEIHIESVVHAYSSETGTWSRSTRDWRVEEEQGELERWRHQDQEPCCEGSAFFNGMLHLLLMDEGQVVVVDVQGKTRRIIHLPIAEKDDPMSYFAPHIAASQGRLHYMHRKLDVQEADQSYLLFIWVLNDCDTQEWILKGTVNFLELLGQSCRYARRGFPVVSTHPDRNVVFFLQTSNKKLISYHLDHKEVSVITTFEKDCRPGIFPYVPYFSELPALTNMC
ncbi:hypothetical protein ACP70R_015004 [Stipagrostis hirtigluma subsp. patula]